MKRFLSLCLCVATMVLHPALLAAEADEAVAARKAAMELAGAFSNDGFKLRDGHWSGTLEVARPQFIEVNLYSGNQYWFSLGTTSHAKKVAVTVYDESGQPLPVDPYEGDSKAAAGFSATVSGPHIVKIEELAGAPANFCLIYSYK